MCDVALRTLDLPAELLLLAGWLQRPHVSRWWGAHVEASALAERSRTTDAVITVDSRPVGYMCWERLSPAERAEAGLTELPGTLVDIDLFIGESEYTGRGVATRALRLLLARLRQEGIECVGVGTSTANRAALRAFEKAGFLAFRDFTDPDHGPCRYLVAPTGVTGVT